MEYHLRGQKLHLTVNTLPYNAASFVYFNGLSFENFRLDWNGSDGVTEVLNELDYGRDNHPSSKTLVYELLVRLMYNVADNIIVNLSLFRLVADTKVPTVILPFESVLRSSIVLKVRRESEILAGADVLSESVNSQESDSFACCINSRSSKADPPSIKCDLIWPRRKTPEIARCHPCTRCCHLSHVSHDSFTPEYSLEEGLLEGMEFGHLRKLVENENVILYLHGGAYVLCNTRSHRSLIYSVCKKTSCVVFAPNFRRPPESDMHVTLDDTLHSYLYLVEILGVDPTRITVMGESAGGALSISLLIRLRELEEEARSVATSTVPYIRLYPKNAVVISPWVDLAASEDNSASFVTNNNFDSDMFSAEVVKRFANRICKSRSPKDPLISPIYNRLHGLPPLLVVAGERELLRDQIVEFAKRVKEADESNVVTLQIYHDMCHAFLLFEFCHPSAKRALHEICRFLQCG